MDRAGLAPLLLLLTLRLSQTCGSGSSLTDL